MGKKEKEGRLGVNEGRLFFIRNELQVASLEASFTFL